MTLRGVPIGDVKSIQVQPQSVKVVVSVDDDVHINRNTTVSALGLSAAGEQYVDFSPPSAEGPYLRDGDTINVNQTKVTTPFPQLLETSLGVIDQIDPAKLASIVDNLDVALNPKGDTNDLRVLFDAGGTIFADLYRVLPQTTKLISETGTILQTTSQIQPDLQGTVSSLSSVVNAAVAADRELRTLLGKGPQQLSSLSGSINEIQDPITDVLGQLLDVTRQGALRAPAVVNLLPSIRDASIKSLSMFHDGAWWASVRSTRVRTATTRSPGAPHQDPRVVGADESVLCHRGSQPADPWLGERTPSAGGRHRRTAAELRPECADGSAGQVTPAPGLAPHLTPRRGESGGSDRWGPSGRRMRTETRDDR